MSRPPKKLKWNPDKVDRRRKLVGGKVRRTTFALAAEDEARLELIREGLSPGASDGDVVRFAIRNTALKPEVVARVTAEERLFRMLGRIVSHDLAGLEDDYSPAITATGPNGWLCLSADDGRIGYVWRPAGGGQFHDVVRDEAHALELWARPGVELRVVPLEPRP